MKKKEKENKEKKPILNLSSKTKNIIIAAVAVLGVLLLVASPIRKDNSNMSKKGQYGLNPSRMITVYKDGKYGFINTKGKELTKTEYNYVLDYTGEYAITTKDDQYILVDQNGKEVKTTKKLMEYIDENDQYLIEGVLYNNNLRPITSKKYEVINVGNGYFKFTTTDGKTIGVMNKKGKVIYKQDANEQTLYVHIMNTNKNNKNVYCAVSQDEGIFAILNCDTGKQVVKFGPDRISAQGNNIFEIATKENEKKTIFVKNDKVAIEVKGNQKMVYIGSGYVAYQDKDDDNYKYYEIKTGKTYTDEPYTADLIRLSEFENETKIQKINSNGKYGLAKDDTIIIPFEYDRITYLPYDLFSYLARTGKHYFIGTKGDNTYIVDLKTKKNVKKFETRDNINTLATSTFLYFNKEDKIYVYNFVTGKENTYDADSVEIFGNYIKVHKDDKVTYYDKNLNKIYSVTEVEKTESDQ